MKKTFRSNNDSAWFKNDLKMCLIHSVSRICTGDGLVQTISLQILNENAEFHLLSLWKSDLCPESLEHLFIQPDWLSWCFWVQRNSLFFTEIRDFLFRPVKSAGNSKQAFSQGEGPKCGNTQSHLLNKTSPGAQVNLHRWCSGGGGQVGVAA